MPKEFAGKLSLASGWFYNKAKKKKISYCIFILLCRKMKGLSNGDIKKKNKTKRKADNTNGAPTPSKLPKVEVKEEVAEESTGKKKKKKRSVGNEDCPIPLNLDDTIGDEAQPVQATPEIKREKDDKPLATEEDVDVVSSSNKKKKRKSVTPDDSVNGGALEENGAMSNSNKKSPVFSPIASKTRRKSRLAAELKEVATAEAEKSPSPKKPTPIAHKTRRKSMLLQQATAGKSTPKSSKT
jgi:hypothetical protein